jgi:hypothetical protein
VNQASQEVERKPDDPCGKLSLSRGQEGWSPNHCTDFAVDVVVALKQHGDITSSRLSMGGGFGLAMIGGRQPSRSNSELQSPPKDQARFQGLLLSRDVPPELTGGVQRSIRTYLDSFLSAL